MFWQWRCSSVSLFFIPVESHAWRGWHGRGWYGPGLFAGGVVLGAALARPWYAAPRPFTPTRRLRLSTAPRLPFTRPPPRHMRAALAPAYTAPPPPQATAPGPPVTEQGAMGRCAGPDRERPLGARPQGMGTRRRVKEVQARRRAANNLVETCRLTSTLLSIWASIIGAQRPLAGQSPASLPARRFAFARFITAALGARSGSNRVQHHLHRHQPPEPPGAALRLLCNLQQSLLLEVIIKEGDEAPREMYNRQGFAWRETSG